MFFAVLFLIRIFCQSKVWYLALFKRFWIWWLHFWYLVHLKFCEYFKLSSSFSSFLNRERAKNKIEKLCDFNCVEKINKKINCGLVTYSLKKYFKKYFWWVLQFVFDIFLLNRCFCCAFSNQNFLSIKGLIFDTFKVLWIFQTFEQFFRLPEPGKCEK